MVIIVLGVSGAGKTVIGTLLAGELGWKFYDADLLHSAQNIRKMRAGLPLTDEDRAPWLEALCDLLRDAAARGESAVLACSALKEAYRRLLLQCAEARLVYLKGDYELISSRLSQRLGHFMNPKLLRSQFEALEEPQGDAVVVDVKGTPREIVSIIRTELQL